MWFPLLRAEKMSQMITSKQVKKKKPPASRDEPACQLHQSQRKHYYYSEISWDLVLPDAQSTTSPLPQNRKGFKWQEGDSEPLIGGSEVFSEVEKAGNQSEQLRADCRGIF